MFSQAGLETEEVQMETITYFAEIIASLVLWIGIPAVLTLVGGTVLRRISSSLAGQAA